MSEDRIDKYREEQRVQERIRDKRAQDLKASDKEALERSKFNQAFRTRLDQKNQSDRSNLSILQSKYAKNIKDANQKEGLFRKIIETNEKSLKSYQDQKVDQDREKMSKDAVSKASQLLQEDKTKQTHIDKNRISEKTEKEKDDLDRINEEKNGFEKGEVDLKEHEIVKEKKQLSKNDGHQEESKDAYDDGQKRNYQGEHQGGQQNQKQSQDESNKEKRENHQKRNQKITKTGKLKVDQILQTKVDQISEIKNRREKINEQRFSLPEKLINELADYLQIKTVEGDLSELSVKLDDEYFDGVIIHFLKVDRGLTIKFECPNNRVKNTFLINRSVILNKLTKKGLKIYQVEII